MIWILALHIVMLLCWCASLLYLLSVIAGACPSRSGQAELPAVYQHHDSLARFVFTTVATPAALLAIISGTAVFLVYQTVEPWLIVKMTLVTMLVAGHAWAGKLILRLEADGPVRNQAIILACGLSVLMLIIVWIVLAKPDGGANPW
ncbi:MAG: CopD family protein [Pseudohongiella sp.]|nr:CopD family protein [Pseudohongiella sp.]MDO9521018.1 CopD family protein [Pseudohongiella sp.]MDP2128952.1 CopD family protein [Pseudohongiella sp.]